jgi:hypothetical protein
MKGSLKDLSESHNDATKLESFLLKTLIWEREKITKVVDSIARLPNLFTTI